MKRFEIISQRANVLEPGKADYFEIRNRWNEHYFKNTHPLTVELACGRGEYAVHLAKMFPDRNYVGVDVKGDRLWKGSTWAVEQSITNVAFLRAQILTIETFFGENEVDEIWLTFPDPRPRKRDEKRRLTHARFLSMYKHILRPDGYFRFKTDNTALFEYTLEELGQREDVRDLVVTHDLYQSEWRTECFDIQTRFESIFAAKGEKIKYLRFRFRDA
jgi:tRNA (guanine-N7-)-methyltransferase